MPALKTISCALILLLALSGCASPSPTVSQPQPPAWMLQPVQPNLTQRLQQIWQESPQTGTQQ